MTRTAIGMVWLMAAMIALLWAIAVVLMLDGYMQNGGEPDETPNKDAP